MKIVGHEDRAEGCPGAGLGLCLVGRVADPRCAADRFACGRRFARRQSHGRTDGDFESGRRRPRADRKLLLHPAGIAPARRSRASLAARCAEARPRRDTAGRLLPPLDHRRDHQSGDGPQTLGAAGVLEHHRGPSARVSPLHSSLRRRSRLLRAAQCRLWPPHHDVAAASAPRHSLGSLLGDGLMAQVRAGRQPARPAEGAGGLDARVGTRQSAAVDPAAATGGRPIRKWSCAWASRSTIFCRV